MKQTNDEYSKHQHEAYERALNESILRKKEDECKRNERINEVIDRIDKIFKANTFEKIIQYIDEQIKALLTSNDKEIESLNHKVQMMNDGIKNITNILTEIKERIYSHEERISNSSSNETIDEMNDDIENVTVAIYELSNEFNEFKEVVSATVTNHADSINKLGTISYNLDFELCDKIFEIGEKKQEKQE